jgi:hypothetical protein
MDKPQLGHRLSIYIHFSSGHRKHCGVAGWKSPKYPTERASSKSIKARRIHPFRKQRCSFIFYGFFPCSSSFFVLLRTIL